VWLTTNYPFRRLPNKVNSLQNLLNDLLSGDEARAEKAVPELIGLGADALPALQELSRSSDVDSRWWAIRTLSQSPLSPTEWLIPFLLNDSAPEVRQCAALGLGIKASESAINPLVQALSDTNPMVGNLALNSLVKIGKASVPALIDSVKTDSQSARIYALRALAELRDHRAIPVMMQVMEEDSVLLQHWAKEGLERLGLDMVYIKPV